MYTSLKLLFWGGISLFLLLSACSSPQNIQPAKQKRTFPPLIQELMDKHGGFEKWEAAKELVFEIKKDEEVERTTTTLDKRLARIDTKNHAFEQFGLYYDLALFLWRQCVDFEQLDVWSDYLLFACCETSELAPPSFGRLVNVNL